VTYLTMEHLRRVFDLFVTQGTRTSRVCVALLFSIATTALAQQTQSVGAREPGAAPPPAGLAVSADIDRDRMPDPAKGLVRVDVAVTDKAGKSVSGLSEKSFTLFDNDKQQKIVTFQALDGVTAQPATSLEVVLVIDELNMVPNADLANENLEFSEAVRELESFLRADAGVLEKPTIIYRLTKGGLFATPHASRDGNELADEIEQPGKQRQIWSAPVVNRDIGNIANAKGGEVSSRISHSLVALGSIAIEERRRPGRKLVFWIGNAWQIEGRNATGLSDFSIELLTRMREARISLWSASEWPLYDASRNALPVTDYVYRQFLEGPRPGSTDLRYLSLPVIAARSGGGVLYTRHHLATLMGERVKEESSYYSLTFDPLRTGVVDEYHNLRVEVDKPGLTSNVFEDYYDEPVFYDQPPSTERVTVKQLETILANAPHAPEAQIVQQLDGMQLTERLDSTKLAALAKLAHGRKVREALEVLANESVFLAPPAEDIPSTPPPDIDTQRQIISRTISYINTTIPRLPDFFATRTTVQYQELTPRPDQTWKTAWPDQSLHEGETATDSIRFSDGKERVEEKSVKNELQRPGNERLVTTGTFGAILVTVMTAATSPHSELSWSRWEQDETGPLAVFHYRVPQETSLFTAEFCCLVIDFDQILFKKAAPFHGEIAVDPSTGAILRLTTQADLDWRLPLHRSDVMVEYRPVMRGTRTFIIPSRSVSISRQRRTMVIEEWGEGFKVHAPFETLLNEMRFEKYHFFGSTSRMLPGFVEVPKYK
jgi:VWFA-related protein